MNKKIMIAMALTLVLSSCASMQMQWDKPGATASEFDQAKQECIYEVQLHQPGMFLEAIPLITQCMRAKGWSQVR
jgi:hypothetical protein